MRYENGEENNFSKPVFFSDEFTCANKFDKTRLFIDCLHRMELVRQLQRQWMEHPDQCLPD